MIILNRKIFGDFLEIEEIGNFQCPKCIEGRLSHEGENKFIKQIKEGFFVGIIKCNNKNCQHCVALSGKYNRRKEFDIIEDEDEKSCFLKEHYTDEYKINYMNPSINLIEVPDNTPVFLREIILDSFVLFWVDSSSCGNKIRIFLEKLLDYLKIKKILTIKGRRKNLTLHSRIKDHLGGTKLSQIGEELLALKWIGNDGSHDENLNKNDLEDAYQILEKILIKVFNESEKKIQQKVKKINKKKGKIN